MKLRELFSAKQFGLLLPPARGDHQARYESFRVLLNHNRDALRHMAEMEQLYYSDHPIDAHTVRQTHAQLTEHILGLATALNALSGGKFADLPAVCEAIDAAIAAEQAPRQSEANAPAILPLEQIDAGMLSSVGGKAANLAVMKNVLQLPVPDGFVLTATATARFLDASGLRERIRAALATVAPDDMTALETVGATIRQRIRDAPMPPELAGAIVQAGAALEAKTRGATRIAVRSSALGEDGTASFAGQYATVLNVTRAGLLDAFKYVVASKYSTRAIAYRLLQGLDDDETPMCVIVLAMIDAKASGVMYSLDPATLDARVVKIGSLWGLGEQLVGGNATPDDFLVDKATGAVVERRIAHKTSRLLALPEGGTRLEKTGPGQQSGASLTDAVLRQLAAGAKRIEQHFATAQDIEWAVDADDRLFYLQTRPLHLAAPAEEAEGVDCAGEDNLLRGGIPVSRGIAAGPVFIARDERDLSALPEHAILVVPTASPVYAAALGRIAALVTDVGSSACHLASVAREFGIPAIMDAGNATAILAQGETVTVVAQSRVALFRGVPAAFRERMRPARKRYVGSPAHRKLRAMLDHIVPLNLTDSRAPGFAVAGCRTYHDVIRFCHEHAMREMFDLASGADGASAAIRIVTHLPLAVHVIDLGGGLHPKRMRGKRRKTATPEAFASLPLQSIWRGMTHPGVRWEGTVNFAASRFMSVMASIATAELGPEPGGDSYILCSRDYMNFSAKFGYHFATVDTLCGDDASHNYIALQFAGGAGNFFGRSLRVQFLGAVLEQLGFRIALQGDLLEASFGRHGRQATEDRLDQLGRLLASCRLLDMTLANEDSAAALAAAFMAGDYDFLKPRDAAHPENFYTQQGHWSRRVRDGVTCLHQSGRSPAQPGAGALASLIGKTIGIPYRQLLDSIGAYFYFPLAIAKNSEMADGGVTVDLLAEGGVIDRAGGLIFGLANAANYFVFRINALEHNAILFEFADGKRIERARAQQVIRSGRWYRLRAEIAGRRVRCDIDGQTMLEYAAAADIRGLVGVWTKADSATWFRGLRTDTAEGTRIFEF